uniref:SAM-dependent methyltransferase n=1 Tax=Oceaniglobus roseus TaxID=1737570 RepID=UPI00156291D5
DYGSDWSLGDTLQAVRAHRKVAPLDTPGAADLTAHVAFAPLAAAAAPALAAGPVPQGVFLDRLGIAQRARTLAQRDPEGAVSAHRRLTHPDEMGQLFKVLALYGTDGPAPPGILP